MNQNASRSSHAGPDAIGVGLFGTNGHQVKPQVERHPHATLIAETNDELDRLLSDDRVQLVSLCSSRRAEQADHAIAALKAGKHVYAEKPCAFTEAKLDQILETARAANRRFHEMSGSAFVQPWRAIRRVMAEQPLGQIVQVFAQKSYPMRDTRPQDEAVDGGLTMQAGIHAVRFIEHGARVRIAEITACETQGGNPHPHGELRTGAVMTLRLENGGVGAILCNYCNPNETFKFWGNDQLRVFGVEGFLESVDHGSRTRLITREKDHGPIRWDEAVESDLDFFDAFIAELRGEAPFPLAQEEELHPTRVVIRAKASATLRGVGPEGPSVH